PVWRCRASRCAAYVATRSRASARCLRLPVDLHPRRVEAPLAAHPLEQFAPVLGPAPAARVAGVDDDPFDQEMDQRHLPLHVGSAPCLADALTDRDRGQAPATWHTVW